MTEPKKKDAADHTTVRIRQRDTGGVRELTAEQWRKDKKALGDQGFVRVDDHDAAITEDEDD